MKIWNKIKSFFKRKGAKSTMANNFYDESTLTELYEDYTNSPLYINAQIGKRYYAGKNDILDRKKYMIRDTGISQEFADANNITYTTADLVEDTISPNNKIVTNFAKSIIDQKCDYLLSKKADYIMLEQNNNETYLKYLEQILQDIDWEYNKLQIGKRASYSAVAWLHVYIENNKLKTMIVPSEQVVPIWKDDLRQDVSAVLRVYDITDPNNPPENITMIEFWNEVGMQQYKVESDMLVQIQADQDLYTMVSGAYQGANPDEQTFKWSRVPFIPFRNNTELTTDVSMIKAQSDNYDLINSEMSNVLQQNANPVIAISNQGAQSLATIKHNMNLYGILATQELENGGLGAQVLSFDINGDAVNAHLQRIKQNIIETSMSVNFDIDWTQPPSGVTLNILYRNLDIKCNGFEAEFNRSFKILQQLIRDYANAFDNQNFTNTDVANIKCVRDTISNTSDTIEQLKNSKGLISNKTIMENHPLVNDVEKELEQWNKEQDQEANRNSFSGFDKGAY